MLLNTTTPLSELVRQGYQGKAIELLREYPHTTILERERAMIEERLKVVSGPLYDGEAEAILFRPLLRALRAATEATSQGDAMVAKTAYQLSANYAIIHDISKISQSKDIAKEITVGTLQSQPIIAAFNQRLMMRKDIDYSITDNSKDDRMSRAEKIWRGISQILTDGFVVQGKDAADREGVKKYTTPLSLLYNATLPSLEIEKVQQGAMDTWPLLISNLRHGKGTPLDRQGRKVRMSEMSELLMRIDILISNATTEEKLMRTENAANTEWNSTAFVDAYTAMYWLLIYLDAIAEYDVIFPASDIMVQSQAWVLIIKTQAAKLKKLFVDIAQVAASFDLFTAIHFWDEMYRFFDPILNHSISAVSDMTELWSQVKGKADKMLSNFAKTQVDGIFTTFKSYMEADYLLSEKDFMIVSEVLSSYTIPAPVDVIVNDEARKYYIAQGGSAIFTATDTAGEAPVNITDRYMLIPKLADAASTIEEALNYLKRAREILQIVEETDDIYHALLPSGVQWQNPFALSGTIKDMREASFERTDPMQLEYEKYVVSTESSRAGYMVGSLDWRFTPLLMRPFYRIPQLQAFTRARSKASRILWPGMGDLPMGDVISSQYIAQPLPACYTASRNANFVANDMKAYMTLMSGKSGVTASSRDMFRKIAAIIHNFPDTYARGILDALAATMFVYKLKKDKWEVILPSCPTIYGMPLQAMYDANEWAGTDKKSEATASRYERVQLDDGTTYAFVLHQQMPDPENYYYFAYPYTKGAYLHVPLLESIFNEKLVEIGRAMGVNLDGKSTTGEHDNQDLDKMVTMIKKFGVKDIHAKFIPVLGWAPFLVNLPHFLCSYQRESDTLFSEEYRKYALLSVRVRYDNIERAIYVGGFINNPVEVIDMSDYSKAAASSDPTPISSGRATEAPDTEPESKEPRRSEEEAAPDPATLGAQAKDDKGRVIEGEDLKKIAQVTNAPVVDKSVVKVPAAGDAKDKFELGDPSADKLAGDPAKTSASSTDHDQPSGSAERYWKKISASGEIEEVIKAEACPDGYVPASEQEFRDFVVKKQSQEVAKGE